MISASDSSTGFSTRTWYNGTTNARVRTRSQRYWMDKWETLAATFDIGTYTWFPRSLYERRFAWRRDRLACDSVIRCGAYYGARLFFFFFLRSTEHALSFETFRCLNRRIVRFCYMTRLFTHSSIWKAGCVSSNVTLTNRSGSWYRFNNANVQWVFTFSLLLPILNINISFQEVRALRALGIFSDQKVDGKKKVKKFF